MLKKQKLNIEENVEIMQNTLKKPSAVIGPGREATFKKRAQIVRTCISSGNDYDEMALKATNCRIPELCALSEHEKQC